MLSYLTGTNKSPKTLRTLQSAISQYSWNATIVEGMPTDTSRLEQWFSYEGSPSLPERGVHEYGRSLKEVDDFITKDHETWAAIDVPEIASLPYVDGMPHV